MFAPILATKLHIPTPRSKVVSRPRLIARLDAGPDGKLTRFAKEITHDY
jgi:LuxR family maltose regulon positive regulatory protein